MGAAKLPVINCNSERASPRGSDNYNSPSQYQAGASASRSCAARYLISGLGTLDVLKRTRVLTRRPRRRSIGILDQTRRLSANAPLAGRH